MIIEQLTVGAWQENTWLVGNEETGEAFVIDPGGENERLLALAEERGLKLVGMLLTHGHIDHVAGAAELQDRLGLTLRLHEGDNFLVEQLPEICDQYGLPRVDVPRLGEPLRDGERFALAGLEIEVIHTPGHSPGGCCLRLGSELFTGDTLFAGSIGRSDLPGGDHVRLMGSIRERLVEALPGSLRIHCGHGPDSTLLEERETNPFLRGR